MIGLNAFVPRYAIRCQHRNPATAEAFNEAMVCPTVFVGKRVLALHTDVCLDVLWSSSAEAVLSKRSAVFEWVLGIHVAQLSVQCSVTKEATVLSRRNTFSYILDPFDERAVLVHVAFTRHYLC